jgi:hypothetical protein
MTDALSWFACRAMLFRETASIPFSATIRSATSSRLARTASPRALRATAALSLLAIRDVLARAPRASLDLDARRDWLELFPLFETRRPDVYGVLLDGGDPPA